MSPNEALVSIARRLSSEDKSVYTKLQEKHENKTSAPFEREIVWKNVAVYVLGHAAALWGAYMLIKEVTFLQFFPGFLFAWFHTTVGIQMGAHRYYSHKTFKASKAVQVVMLLCQTAASQNCMWVWVRDHRQHHKYSDTDADPHNARNGFFFSHVGWLLLKKHPDVIEKGKGIDMSDLNADPLVMFQKRHYNILWLIFAVALPAGLYRYALGFPVWKCLMTVVVLRIVMTLNITWLVNSWAHFYGTRPFDNNIVPVQMSQFNWLLSGEGYHNYHHTFPWDYNASELGSPYNVPGKVIRLLARMGHAWDLRTVSEEMIYKRAEKTGDGSPYLAKQKFNPSKGLQNESLQRPKLG